MIDLNDNFLQDESMQYYDQGKFTQNNKRETSYQPATVAKAHHHQFGTARNSIEQNEKYNSLIRQYERNHDITDS